MLISRSASSPANGNGSLPHTGAISTFLETTSAGRSTVLRPSLSSINRRDKEKFGELIQLRFVDLQYSTQNIAFSGGSNYFFGGQALIPQITKLCLAPSFPRTHTSTDLGTWYDSLNIGWSIRTCKMYIVQLQCNTDQWSFHTYDMHLSQ